jgi:hypothetical protein
MISAYLSSLGAFTTILPPTASLRRIFLSISGDCIGATSSRGWKSFMRGLVTADEFTRFIAVVGALVYCDPHHRRVAEGLQEILAEDWGWDHIFGRDKFPVARVPWTGSLLKLVEDYIASKERYREYEFYWIAKVCPLPVLKQRFIEALKTDEHFSFWSARALTEVWGPTDPEIQSLFEEFLSSPSRPVEMIAEVLPQVIKDHRRVRDALYGAPADVLVPLSQAGKYWRLFVRGAADARRVAGPISRELSYLPRLPDGTHTSGPRGKRVTVLVQNEDLPTLRADWLREIVRPVLGAVVSGDIDILENPPHQGHGRTAELVLFVEW